MICLHKAKWLRAGGSGGTATFKEVLCD